MTAFIEPIFFCLLASMIWAPIVFSIAARYQSNDNPGFADKVWPAALLMAALPALLAPFAAAFGMSLRNPPPLPPISAGAAMPVEEIIRTEPIAAPISSINIAATLDAISGLYVYGFLLFVILGAFHLVWFSYRVRFAYPLDEPRLEENLEVWRRRMGLKKRPQYAFTDAVSSVCVHGFFRSTILMPMSLLDRVSIEDATLMGAHEMAHIRRGDTWLFAFATVVKALFWFNPFIQRIAARANLAAEQAADALVIARGANRRDYAKCFVTGLRFATGADSREFAIVPSFTPFDKRSRRERLDAILSRSGSGAFLSLPNKIGLMLSIIAAAGLAFAQAAFAVTPPAPEKALTVAPVIGDITFGFLQKSAVLGSDRPAHEGIDIRAPRGTIVRAAGDGKVIEATNRFKGKTAWGNVVVIDHGHGLITRYAHMKEYTVKKGDHVDAGDKIGAVGSTGKSTGPHLHFEVINNGELIDPAPVVIGEAPRPPKPVKIKEARAVTLAPTPPVTIEATPDAPKLADRHEELERKLEGRAWELNRQIRERLNGFDVFEDFDDLAGQFGEMDFDGFEFDLDGFERFEIPDMTAMLDAFELSKEDRKELLRAQKQAKREVRNALREANRELKRAKREHQHNAAELRAEHIREKVERDIERALERAERQAERELEFTNKNRLRNQPAEAEQSELLDLRERALKEAQKDLATELLEIERMRAELKNRDSDAD